MRLYQKCAFVRYDDPAMNFAHKDLLGIKYLNSEEILFIIELARKFKKQNFQKIPSLAGKSLMQLFFEPSTRTKISFEQSARKLGLASSSLSADSSSTKKGETLLDTAKNLEVLGFSAFVIRHAVAGVPELIAKHVSIPVINAGDGFNEHPTQALLDIMSMMEDQGDLKGKKIGIVGDIAHSRVARSNIWALNQLGAKVWVIAPPTLMPVGIERWGVEISSNLDQVLPKLDFLNVLRMQLERQNDKLFPSVREYFRLFGIHSERMKNTQPHFKILHPGPINRGVEISSNVVDGDRNLILKQVENGIAIRAAVLALLLNK